MGYLLINYIAVGHHLVQNNSTSRDWSFIGFMLESIPRYVT